MPYKKIKKKCKQSDGDAGEWVLSYTDKKGKKHSACHTSKKNMQGQIAAIESESVKKNKIMEKRTVKITIKELNSLIKNALSEVTHPFPVYEADYEKDSLSKTHTDGKGNPDLDFVSEDSGEREGENYRRNWLADLKHMKNLKKNMAYDKRHMQEASEESITKAKKAFVDSMRSDAQDVSDMSDDEIVDMIENNSNTLTEAVMVALQPMIKPVHQEMTQDEFWIKVAGIKAEPMNEGEVVDFPGGGGQDSQAYGGEDWGYRAAERMQAFDDYWADADNPGLPTEFIDDKKEAYINREQFRQKMSDLDYGSDSAPEDILAIALSNRAEELEGFRRTVAPEPFKDLAMDMYKSYIVGKSGDRAAALQDITSRIDAGGYFDEDIEDVVDAMQMSRTKEMASQQSARGLADMDMDFEKYMQGIESGKIIPLESD